MNTDLFIKDHDTDWEFNLNAVSEATQNTYIYDALIVLLVIIAAGLAVHLFKMIKEDLCN
jgi:hypothetical protein